ncbi:ORF6C domain-containing protein [Bacillus sp. SCS-151]|uniref:ORF6C domain-containing protein n=1 Tax=Nanhaiella sioensis TaxID=3115293 RepID=UPI0039780205
MAIDVRELEKYTDAELESVSQITLNIKINRLQSRVALIENKLEMIETTQELHNAKLNTNENKFNDVEQNQNRIIQEIKEVKDATLVLATDDGKRKAFTKLINSLCYKKYTGKKNSLKDKLFHRVIVDSCYKRVYDQFEINSYTRIKLEDYDESKKVVYRWYNNKQNIENAVFRRLEEYQGDDDLSEEKLKMVKKFLKLSNGGKNIWY